MPHFDSLPQLRRYPLCRLELLGSHPVRDGDSTMQHTQPPRQALEQGILPDACDHATVAACSTSHALLLKRTRFPPLSLDRLELGSPRDFHLCVGSSKRAHLSQLLLAQLLPLAIPNSSHPALKSRVGLAAPLQLS